MQLDSTGTLQKPFQTNNGIYGEDSNLKHSIDISLIEEEGIPNVNNNIKKSSIDIEDPQQFQQLIKICDEDVKEHVDNLLKTMKSRAEQLKEDFAKQIDEEVEKKKKIILSWAKEKHNYFEVLNDQAQRRMLWDITKIDKEKLIPKFAERKIIQYNHHTVLKSTQSFLEDKNIISFDIESFKDFVDSKNHDINKNKEHINDENIFDNSLEDLDIHASISQIRPEDLKHIPYNVNDGGNNNNNSEEEKLDELKTLKDVSDKKLDNKQNESGFEIKSSLEYSVKVDDESTHVNGLNRKEIKDRVTKLSINDWKLTNEEYDELFNGKTKGGFFGLFGGTKPSIYTNRLGRFINKHTIDLSGDIWTQLTTKEKEIIRECLTFQRVICNSPRKFPELGQLLNGIHTLLLNKIGKDFGLEGCKWVAPILTSKYSSIRTVHIEGGCNISEECLGYINDQFYNGFDYIENHKHLHLKCLRIETNMGNQRTNEKSSFLDIMLQKSNVDRICLDRSPYELKGERRMATPGGPNQPNAAKWEFVLYVLQDF